MARVARGGIPGIPHHVTQRGNRRERILFEGGDEQVSLNLLPSQLNLHQVECWAYCLMPNQVHLILTPSYEAGLASGRGLRNWSIAVERPFHRKSVAPSQLRQRQNNLKRSTC